MVAAALSGQKLPAGHPAHAMLEVVVQKDETYCPGVHVPQAVHAPAFVPVE